MRVLTIATAMLALVAMPAYAQMGGKAGHQTTDSSPKVDPAKKKADEKAYKDVLERIPEPKEKYDPWGVTKPGDAAKKP